MRNRASDQPQSLGKDLVQAFHRSRLLEARSLGGKNLAGANAGASEEEVRLRLPFGAELNSRDRHVTPLHPQPGRLVAAYSLTVSSEGQSHSSHTSHWKTIEFNRTRLAHLSLTATEVYGRC